MRFAVFASGRGGNLQAIINAVKRKKIKADLKLVLSDKPGAFALKRAQKARIPTLYLNPKDYAGREDFDRAALAHLKEHGIDFIVLAGYMRLLGGHFIRQYQNRILNVHPALLPAFKGAHGIRDAFNYGVKVTGVTVHFVIEEMDSGAIIAQEALRVGHKDTLRSLEAKIHTIEHRIYPKAIDLFARGKVKLAGGKVIVLR